MKNHIQPGDTLTLPAPTGGILSGKGFLVGSIFAVASYDAAEGEDVEGVTVGVFELPKVSAQAWTQGAFVYWDSSSKLCTTVVGSNLLIGVAVAAAANPTATGRVRLNGSFAPTPS